MLRVTLMASNERIKKLCVRRIGEDCIIRIEGRITWRIKSLLIHQYPRLACPIKSVYSIRLQAAGMTR